jgi:hypothetical protein
MGNYVCGKSPKVGIRVLAQVENGDNFQRKHGKMKISKPLKRNLMKQID